jgi:hypothetical protein
MNEWRTIFANNLCEQSLRSEVDTRLVSSLDLCRRCPHQKPPFVLLLVYCLLYSILLYLLYSIRSDPPLADGVPTQATVWFVRCRSPGWCVLCCVVLIVVSDRPRPIDGLHPESGIQDSLSSSFTPKASRRISRFSQYSSMYLQL